MRNRFFLLVFLTCLTCSSFSSRQDEGIRIQITQLRNDRGHVLISLFKEGQGYPDKPEKAFHKEKLEIRDRKASVKFSSLPAGEYAIAILHDENGDRRMNTNFLGLPKEGYGFSNNVMGAFGPPAYSKARFRHEAGQLTNIEIRTRY